MNYLLKEEEIYKRANEGDLSVLAYTTLVRKKGLMSQEQKNYLDLLALKNKFLRLGDIFEIYRKNFSLSFMVHTYKFMNVLYKQIEDIVMQICREENIDLEDIDENSLKRAEDDNAGLVNPIVEIIGLNNRRSILLDMYEDIDICLEARYSFMTITKEGKLEKKVTEERVFLN